MFPQAEHRKFSEIPEGLLEERAYEITPAVSEAFLAAFQDYSPIHIDDQHAREGGFPRKIAHGAILNGFLSHFIGMHLPGYYGLYLSSDLRFLKACYVGDSLRLEGKVSQKVESQRVLVLKIRFHNLTQGYVSAQGRVQVKMRDEN